MLYYLHFLSETLREQGYHGDLVAGLNVFQYITFRSISAGITAFLISLIFGNVVIRKLISLKFGQPVRTKEEVHKLYKLHGEKAGTPTMGGLLLLGSVLVSTLLWARYDNSLVWLVLIVMLTHGMIGFYDDWQKVAKKNSKGISSRAKFGLQCLLAAGVTAFLMFGVNPELKVTLNALYVPFFKAPIIPAMGLFAFVFYLFIIVGTSNAVNLTDGLDGLATGCTIAVAATFSGLAYVAGNSIAAGYLQIPFVPPAGELAVICMALAGAGLGFLWWNCHPARVFMGDTGSLAIGGMLGAVAICVKQEFLLAIVGGVFVIEALSVIGQVVSFKLTGKRILRMAPIHHHFELSGWKESTVIVRFWIMSLIFALLGLATLKLR